MPQDYCWGQLHQPYRFEFNVQKVVDETAICRSTLGVVCKLVAKQLATSKFFGRKMDVCDVINDVRDCGVVHCGITESEHITLAELASRFGLIFTPNTYREISKFQAAAVAKGVLHSDLAYDSEIMPETAAQALANFFLGYFDEEDTHYYTNGDYYVADESSHGWNPATTATFDTGILVIGKLKAGCLWVEDED